MSKLTKKTVLQNAKDYFFIVVGLAIFAFGWSAFLIPSELIGGGVAGIASLIYFGTEFPVGVSTLAINLVLVAMAYKVLGTKFTINTIACSFILSAFFSVFQPIFVEPIVNDLFLCSLMGSVLAGIGVGIVLNYGGNTGGLDIIVLLISHYRNVAYGKTTLMMNIVIVASSYLLIGSVEILVYCYVAQIAYMMTSDKVIDSYKQTFQILIFSKKNDAIADRINVDLKRGATLLKAYGSYTKVDNDVLLVIAHREDRLKIVRIIKEVDEKAFLTINKTSGVFGENFDKLRL